MSTPPNPQVAPSAPKPITFLTSNPNKLAEVRAILGEDVPMTHNPLDLVEIQAGSLEAITADKCVRGASAINGPVLVEDTALCYKALGGLPGAYIKWFMTIIGHAGLNNLLAAYDDKSAEAVCTFAFCEGPGKEVKLFQGRMEGKIVPARGPSNFGWDAIFEYEGETYAEMNKAKKNSISHRFKALEKLKAYLQTRTLGGETTNS